MSGFLITSSVATTVLIAHQEFEEGGQANGRALAYLAHQYLGSGFGTAYDLSTIGILRFAGASAMAGLLNIVPRYLPRYGRAPEWTRAARPLALAFTVIAFAITVFAYTTIANVIERPDGVKIASFFIAAILVTSLISRVTRATELRVTRVELDATARRFVKEAAAKGEVRIIANEPHARDLLEYLEKEHEERLRNQIPADDPVLFLEVTVADPRAPAALPDLRQRRGRTRHPRGPPGSRTRPPPTPLRPRRLNPLRDQPAPGAPPARASTLGRRSSTC
jgi:hypothetical protein